MIILFNKMGHLFFSFLFLIIIIRRRNNYFLNLLFSGLITCIVTFQNKDATGGDYFVGVVVLFAALGFCAVGLADFFMLTKVSASRQPPSQFLWILYRQPPTNYFDGRSSNYFLFFFQYNGVIIKHFYFRSMVCTELLELASSRPSRSSPPRS